MLELLKKPNVNFISKRYYAFGFSGLLVVLGIIAFMAVVFGRGKLGIDFSGGTMIQGNFAQAVSTAVLREAMNRNGYGDAEIQELQREIPNSFLIRVKATAETGSQVANQLISVLAKEFPNNKFNLDSVDEVGPAVGQTLQSKARLAVLISLIGILLYIWVRFDFRFGVAATVATFHDVLAVLGIFFILHKEITLLVITAILTLAGYSLTDTVVVFDRIRENLRLFRKRGDFPTLINTSINEVLSRTIITSTTVFLVVTVLFFLGGEVLHDFALALMMGVIVGTYSSVFVASPILVEWERKVPKRFK